MRTRHPHSAFVYESNRAHRRSQRDTNYLYDPSGPEFLRPVVVTSGSAALKHALSYPILSYPILSYPIYPIYPIYLIHPIYSILFTLCILSILSILSSPIYPIGPILFYLCLILLDLILFICPSIDLSTQFTPSIGSFLSCPIYPILPDPVQSIPSILSILSILYAHTLYIYIPFSTPLFSNPFIRSYVSHLLCPMHLR